MPESLHGRPIDCLAQILQVGRFLSLSRVHSFTLAMISFHWKVVETSAVRLWEEVDSARRELTYDRCRLNIAKDVCTSVEHN